MEGAVTACPPPAPRGLRGWGGHGGAGVAGGALMPWRRAYCSRYQPGWHGGGGHRLRTRWEGAHTLLYSMPFSVCVQKGGLDALARWAGPVRVC